MSHEERLKWLGAICLGVTWGIVAYTEPLFPRINTLGFACFAGLAWWALANLVTRMPDRLGALAMSRENRLMWLGAIGTASSWGYLAYLQSSWPDSGASWDQIIFGVDGYPMLGYSGLAAMSWWGLASLVTWRTSTVRQ